MDEERDSYKTLIMDAARIAVKGGAMTIPFEDFIIDYMDELIDSLDDDEFYGLVMNEHVTLKRIVNDSEYVRYSEWIAIAENTLTQEVNELEKERLMRYIETLKEETEDYERRFF
jgi:uncharacterized membrane-anchored protein